jgi:hypothetical protein
MKLKFLLLAVILMTVASTVAVLVTQSNAHHKPRQSQLPAAISNYNQTFKLNTSPPLWPNSQKSGGTNGLTAK